MPPRRVAGERLRLGLGFGFGFGLGSGFGFGLVLTNPNLRRVVDEHVHAAEARRHLRRVPRADVMGYHAQRTPSPWDVKQGRAATAVQKASTARTSASSNGPKT